MLLIHILYIFFSRISDTIENHVDKTPTKLVRVEVRTDATKDGAYAWIIQIYIQPYLGCII